MKTRFWIGLGLGLQLGLLVLAGCSDGDDEVLGTDATPEPSQVAQPAVLELSALFDGEGEREATVKAFVVWNEGGARLCEVLMESFPPQCGGLAITLANPEQLDVELENAGGVRWTDGYVNVEGFFDGNRFILNEGGGANGATGPGDVEPTLADEALADAFLAFVADPSSERFAQLPLADSVALGLGEEIIKTLPADTLIDPINWTIDREEFRAWSGPFSALWFEGSPVDITVGSHPRCAAEPVPAPPGFAEHRRVSLQPTDATSCLEWWTVDFFVDPAGDVAAITLDLFAP